VANGRAPMRWRVGHKMSRTGGGIKMRCVFCGDSVDLNDPEVFSLVARWDGNSLPLCEDAIHRECLSHGRGSFRHARAQKTISLVPR
jgi:hypothetical protein